MKKYEKTGKQMPLIYHGGPRKITSIDPKRFQSRDAGFYGAGFYTTTNKEFSKSYGSAVTTLQFKPSAKILIASITPENAPNGLVEAVISFLYKTYLPRAKKRGRVQNLKAELNMIRTDHITWTQTVDDFVKLKKYDAVVYGAGEVVVKNLKSIVVVGKTRKKPAKKTPPKQTKNGGMR